MEFLSRHEGNEDHDMEEERVETDAVSHMVTPGESITSDVAFMRGHGTFHSQDNTELIASVYGVVERVNMLISVRARKSRLVVDVIVCH